MSDTSQIILEEEEFQFDEVLLGALAQPKNRLLILKLEKDLEKFIIDIKRTKFEMKPMNPYQRLLVHRVAQYFRLDHVVADVPNMLMDDASKQKRAMILFKSPQSRVPALKLADLVEQPEEKEAPTPVILPPPAKNIMIMKRTNTPTLSGNLQDSKSGDTSSNPKNMTLEQREEEYQKARARIFGGAENAYIDDELSTKEKELADEFEEMMKLSSPKMIQEPQPEVEEPPRILNRVKQVQTTTSPNMSPTQSHLSFSPSPTSSPHFGVPFSPPPSPSMPFHPNLWMYQMQMYAQMGVNPPVPKPTFPFPMMHSPNPYPYPMFPMAQPTSTYVAPVPQKMYVQHSVKQTIPEEPPKPAVVSHILEISWKSTASDETKDKFLKMLRDEGASLKLIRSKVIAVFKSANAAKKASEKVTENDPGVLGLWKLPTAHIPLNQLSPKSTTLL